MEGAMTPLSILALAAARSDDRLAVAVAGDLARRHASTARVVDVFDSLPQPTPSFQAGAAPQIWKMRIEDRGVARREIAALVRQEAERLSGSTGDNAAP